MEDKDRFEGPQTVMISRVLAEDILLYLQYTQDDGPENNGWKSQELISCIQSLKKALGQRPLYM